MILNNRLIMMKVF